MRKYVGLALGMLAILALASSALALKWPTDMSYRVETMGGATLGIEDETTDINSFNHENVAGVALLPKNNRLDLGLFYSGDTIDTPAVSGISSEIKKTYSDIELTRPGAEYRGVTYWLDSDTVVRVGIEGLDQNSKTSVTGAPDETFAFTGVGGGVSLNYLVDKGFSIGAGVTYSGAGGKPGSLDGAYDIFNSTSYKQQIAAEIASSIAKYAPSIPLAILTQYVENVTTAQTTKLEVSASNLDWAVGAAYQMDLADKNILTIGVNASADDARPNTASINPSTIDASSLASMFNDYSGVINTAGSFTSALSQLSNLLPDTTIDISDKMTLTTTPFKVSAEAVYDMGKMLQAGLLFDMKNKSVDLKDEQTVNGTTTTTDLKVASASIMGITPMVRCAIDLGGVTLLPGLSYSTYGTGTLDYYDFKPGSTSDTYKTTEEKDTAGLFKIGVGLQALQKQLALALQYESGSDQADTSLFDSDGNQVGSTTSVKTTSSAVRLGAEYWVMPILALRVGYAMLQSVLPDGTTDGSGNPVDLKTNTGSLTFGAGVSLPQGWVTDLLIKLDTITYDPAPTPNPTQNVTGIYLGLRIPM